MFIASSIMHTVLPYHRGDYRKLPNEDAVLASLRSIGLTRGLYNFPHCTHKEMKEPAVQEKFKQGPVGFLTIFPSGAVNMPKFLIQWFIFLPAGRFLRRLSRRAHRFAWRSLSPRAARRRHRCVPRVRPGFLQQRDLERPDMEHDHQRSV
ncbi:MAG: hypothetical protein WBE13_22085 [Candidatus Acidiferrum sp.]